LLGLALLVALFNTPAEAQRRKKCNTALPDSSLLVSGPVYRECDVDRAASRVGLEPKLSSSSTPAGTSHSSSCTVAEFRFVVDTSGKVEPAGIEVARTDDRSFSQAVLVTLNELRYRPAMRDGVPVRQLVTYRRTRSVVVTTTTVVSSGAMPTAADLPMSGPSGTTSGCR